MGSSCSSGSKKDKCSKKKKVDNNGANQNSHRGSNASNSSVYVYRKASGGEAAAPEEAEAAAGIPPQANGADVGLVPTPSSQAMASARPAPARPRVERVDSHSAASVSSPMSPTQLLRQTSKDGDQESGMGRIDLLSVPEHIRCLVTGNLQDAILASSPRSLRLVLCRYGCDSREQQEQQASELKELETQIFSSLNAQCVQRGYELETLVLDEDANQSQWQWVLDEQSQPLTIFLLVTSECQPFVPNSLPPHLPPRAEGAQILAKYYERNENETVEAKTLVLRPSVDQVDKEDVKKLKELYPEEMRSGWEWISEKVCAEASLCRHTVAVWKRLLQSPFPFTKSQQQVLEAVDESRLVKCTLKWKDGDATGNVEPASFARYLVDVCALALPVLTSLVDSMLNEADSKDPISFASPAFTGVSQRLYTELVEQTRLVRELAPPATVQQDQENSAVLAAIRNYLQSDTLWPLVVSGAAGSGKSRVLASAVQSCCSQWLPNAHLVFRFAHQTPQSQSVERLLISVIEQCCLLLGEPRPSGVQAADLPGLLQRLAPVRPLVVLLDGLDSIVSSSSSFQWLPSLLPDNVRLVLTVTEPSPLLDHLRTLLAVAAVEHAEAGFVAIPPLEVNVALELLTSQLAARGRKLTAEQQEHCEAAVKQCPCPAYVALVVQCAVHTKSSQSLAPLPSEPTLTSGAEFLLARLEEELDSPLFPSALTYILLSKHGLSIAELSALLLLHPTTAAVSPAKETVRSKAITLLVHELYERLAPSNLRKVVVGRRALLRSSFAPFAEAVRNRYWSGAAGERWRLDCFSAFRAFWEAAPAQFGTRLNHRKLDELPRSYRQVPSPERFVFDWNWVLAKVSGSSVDELLEDVEEAAAGPEVDVLAEVLRSSMPALTYDGRQLFTQIHARLTLPSVASYPHLTQLLETCSTSLPAPSLLCPTGGGYLAPVASAAATTPPPSATSEASERGATFASLHRIKDNPYFVVSLSPAHDEVIVWNIYEQREVRRMRGIAQPRNIRFIDQHRAVILCNRELCIYDLNEARFLMKLKGVMNQKMPYYGLHDADHVVAMSRNRMYVNMMNLTSGDCVATFKVGEDRFLNSLLVSANGRICVCGDETQKPSPLLVWDLDSRKLLYDLRIPHHDFVTSLSAITSDGHYVVCVCQDVSDPSPNFIIVYDLQSGSPFKKWKPAVNTCSVAISSEGGCVVTGLLDTSILVWDLTTGACRHVLQGHTAPVTVIRLDDSGHRCLTADLPRVRDPAIRLWDLSKGECLASFVADSPVVCCELTSNGQAVLLGLADRPVLLTLVLVEEGGSIASALPPTTHYGDPEHDGKQVDFGDTGG